MESAEPWLFTTVPFKPKKTPPFTLRGSILICNLLSEVTAKIDARRDNGVYAKASLSRFPIKEAVPSPVLRAMLPVNPSVTMTSTLLLVMSPPSTKPTNEKLELSQLCSISSYALCNSTRPLCSSVPTLRSPTLGFFIFRPFRAYDTPIKAY